MTSTLGNANAFLPEKSGLYCFHESKNYAYILHAGSNQTAFYRKERQSRDLELYQSFSSQPIETAENVQRRWTEILQDTGRSPGIGEPSMIPQPTEASEDSTEGRES